eukprot:COSAG01_NODE_15546_length_1323_cov_17.705306_2_plen_138_part_00
MMPTDKSLRLPSEVAIGTPGPGRTAGVRPPSPHSRVWLAGRATPSGDPAHETDRKILKSAQQGYCIKIPYYSTSLKSNQQQQKSSASCSGLVVFPRQRPPSRTPQLRRGPLRQRDVRGVRLGSVAADPLYRHIRARW